MLHPEIRPNGPSILHILLGILKITHIKQFIVIVLSINILLCLFQVLSIKAFFIIMLACGILLIVLTMVEYFIKRYRAKRQQNQDELMPLIDHNPKLESHSSNLKPHIRYDLKYFSKTDAPDEPDICGVCLQKIPEGTEVAVLPCMHSFHLKCIKKWAKVNSTCPFCKAAIV